MRNTAETPRVVVPVRLSAAERKRISRAAEARDLAFSSYVRWAALEAASDQLERERPKPRSKPVALEREPVVFDPEPESPAPEEAPFRPHSFVDGECSGCGLDLNDHRGRDRSCVTQPEGGDA